MRTSRPSCGLSLGIVNVISGSPRLFQPYVINARYAAAYRNWYWRYKKATENDSEIKLSSASNYYPSKTAPIGDEAVNDKGGNFGRFARTGLMDQYIDKLFHEELAGIPLSAWQGFLSIFSEGWTEDRLTRILDRVAGEFSRKTTGLSQETISQIRQRLLEIADLLQYGR